MNAILWIVQGLLAVLFGASGAFKGTASKEDMIARGQTGVQAYSVGFIRFIATAELLGCAGLILPRLTGTARIRTPLAAVGLGIIMVGAGVSHARLALASPARRRREILNVGTNLVVLGACLFVAIGRG